MATYIAGPSDVRVEIDTVLDDNDIDAILDRAARDIQRDYHVTEYLDDLSEEQVDDSLVYFDNEPHRQDFEATLAAKRIAEGRDRRAESESMASLSVTYEANEVQSLRARLSKLDPGDEFSMAGLTRRDSDRYTRFAERGGDE